MKKILCLFAGIGFYALTIDAHAACVISGNVVTCTGVDGNGYASNTNGLVVNVDLGSWVITSGSVANSLSLANNNWITNNGTINPIISTRVGLRARGNNTVFNNSYGIITADAANAVLFSLANNHVDNS